MENWSNGRIITDPSFQYSGFVKTICNKMHEQTIFGEFYLKYTITT